MAIDPRDQIEVNKLYQEYIRLLQIADGLTANEAKLKADTAKAAGNLTKEIGRLNKELNDTLIKSDYLFESFRETTAELKNQNILLQIGKSTFKGLTDIASNLNYFQQGITDLNEKQLKKQQQKLQISELELDTVVQRLSNINGEYNRQVLLDRLLSLKRNSILGLTKEQEKLLKQLSQEKSLLEITKNALEEGIPILKEELKISKQIYDVREDVGGLAKAAAGVISQYGGSLAQFLNINDAIESVEEYNKKLIDGALRSKNVINKIKQIEQDKENILQNSINLQQSINDISREIKNINTQTNEEINLRNDLLYIQNQLQTATGAERLRLLNQQAQISQKISDIDLDRATKISSFQNQLQQKQNELLQDEIVSKQKLANLDKKEVKIKQDAIKSVDNFGNKFKSLGVFVKELGSGIKKTLTDPVIILTFIIGKALEANKQVVELGKSLGYGVGRADDFREKLVDIERASNNINVNTKNLTEAFNELVQTTGFAYEFTADQLETQIKLTKQVGLQADEAAQIQRFNILTGKSSEETYRSFVRGLTTARNQLRVGINFKAVLAEAVKVSGQLAANLRNNPEIIAKAVVIAKAFGMTLEQVAAAGDKLLDFAGSIESELKAELLLGKQINLERARAAALAGDQVILAEELSKNIGTAAEFTKLNRLQQNALAESVGMTSDQLAETLRKREEALASGKSLAQITEEEAAQALERQNIQDKFNAAILKLQDLIGNIVAGPLGSFIDLLSGALNIVNKIGNALSFLATPLKIIAGLWLTIKGIQLASLVTTKAITVYEGMKRAYVGAQVSMATGYNAALLIRRSLLAGELAKTIAIAAAWVVTNPIPALIGLGVAGAISAGLYALIKGNDVISEGGYGKRTLLAPEGAIRLNDKDTVIAGTNLGLKKEKNPQTDLTSVNKLNDKEEKINFTPQTDLNPLIIDKNNNNNNNLGNKTEKNITLSQMDMTSMIAAINEVKVSIDKLYNKDTSINMDGRKVGSTLVQGSYKAA